MALAIGDVVDGKYKIVRLLGEGGMGVVFEGENTRIHRRVAIKVLHAGNDSNEEAVRRFEREAQAAGRIGSDHIVEVLDLGDLPGGERYMVMEFLDGESLSDRIGRGAMKPRDIATLAVGLLEGLRAAHAAQIVHRDLKPDNVFILRNRGGERDFVKIVDFGISKFNALGGEFSMTRTGAVMGTPYYMSPEQAKGGSSIDQRADIYAVGVILYQAVVGKVPFQAETFNELLFKIVLETPPKLSEQVKELDPHFVSIVERAMSRDVDARFQSAEAFQSALRAWLGGTAIPAGETLGAGTPMMDKTLLPEQAGPSMVTPDRLATPALRSTATSGTAPQKDPVPAAGAASVEVDETQEDFSIGNAGLPGGAMRSRSVVLGAMGLLVLLALGLVFFGFGSSGDDPEHRELEKKAQEASEAVKREADTGRAALLLELEQERALAREARAKAEQAQLEAAKNRSDVEAQLRASEAAREAAEKETAAEHRAISARETLPKHRASATPAVAPRPATPATEPASQKPRSQPSSGRIIRTDI